MGKCSLFAEAEFDQQQCSESNKPTEDGNENTIGDVTISVSNQFNEEPETSK